MGALVPSFLRLPSRENPSQKVISSVPGVGDSSDFFTSSTSSAVSAAF